MGAGIGALAASAALTLAAFLNPSVLIDFDEDPPDAVASGFYRVERTADESLAWTSSLATITLKGIDRDIAWACSIRMRGAHPIDLPHPDAAFGIDGITVRTEPAGHEFRDIEVEAPASPRARSLTLTILTTPTFVPTSSDKRELGVQVDGIRCVPANGARADAPSGALFAVTCAGAAFGVLIALLTQLSLAGASIVFLSSALALVMSGGLAAYSTPYVDWIVPVALGITIPLLAGTALRRWTRPPLHEAAAFVIVFSSIVLFLKIIALLHPSKDLVDAVFHAHRLDTVLAGNYFFTQPMPGGVRFPYAVGLYVTASPFAGLVTDHVALLRIVVCVFEAVAAALLYTTIVASWRDRLGGASAVVLYHLAPLPYVIVGNANLTFAFAQSVSVITLIAATVLPFRPRWLVSALGLMLIASLAFLSHVGVFPVLALSLVALGLLYLWRGGPEFRPAAWSVVGATVLAAALAVGLYYAHFPEVWSTIDRVRSPVAAAPTADTPQRPAPLSLGERAARAVAHGKDAYALPLLLLTFPGLFLVWKGTRDRLTLGLAAWGLGFAAFLAFRIIAPVDARLQRYADEFIDRLYYILLPAVAILAARAAAAGWRTGSIVRWVTVGLIVAAAVLAALQWRIWIT
jgi:hypothetical protein